MIDPFQVQASEHRAVRVFSVGMEAGGARAFDNSGAIDAALGIDGVDGDYVEVFPVSDLAGIGLATYLVDGCGVPEQVIEPDRARLDDVTGYVMVVLSKAFGGRAVQIAPAAQLRLVGIYAETPVDWSPDGPIKTRSALPGSGVARPAQAPKTQAGRVGSALIVALLLIVVAVLLLFLF